MWLSVCTAPVVRSTCASLLRTTRSPWRTSTLPLRVALSAATSLSSAVTSIGPPSALLSWAAAAAAARVAAGAASDGDCDGQGGSSARAAGMMLPSVSKVIQNGLERSMKGGIIMAGRSDAGRKTPSSQMLETDARLALIHNWLSRELTLPVTRIAPASSDASFRRYFRVWSGSDTYVVMDAPPQQEDVRPYLKVSALLEELGTHVPHVHESDVARGLVLLEDLGTTLYLQRLEAGDDCEPLYAAALDALARIQ